MSQFRLESGLPAPHRGSTILVLGILSLVIGCLGWVFGVVAWTMANSDLRSMDAGRMDASGRGLTQAGKACGMISVALHLLGLAMFVLWILFLGGLTAIGAAAAGHR